MEFSSRPRTLTTVTKEIKKGKWNFDSPLQRKENQWNLLQKSELIDSIFRSFPFDPIRGIRRDENTFEVIDGKQRATCIRDYLNNEYKLHKSLLPVIVDGVEYVIAGKKFEALDEVLQDMIKSFEVQIYTFTNCTDDEIREMFRRQNNGKPLSNTQKRTVIENTELAGIITSLTAHPFFSKIITQAQAKKDDDKDIVREILMLTVENEQYDFGSFRNTDINKFIAYYNDNINYDKVELVRQALDKLDELIEDIKIKKLVIPMMVYGMYKTIKDHKSTTKYVEWLNDFVVNYDTNEAFLAYCSGGTANADMVKGRMNYFKSAVNSL